MGYRIVPCDIGDCRRMHGVIATGRRKPAPYTGSFVRAQRPDPHAPSGDGSVPLESSPALARRTR